MPTAPLLLQTTLQDSHRKVVAEKLIKAHAIVNKFLSSFVDHSLADHGYHVLDYTRGNFIFTTPFSSLFLSQCFIQLLFSSFFSFLFNFCTQEHVVFFTNLYLFHLTWASPHNPSSFPPLYLALHPPFSMALSTLYSSFLSFFTPWWILLEEIPQPLFLLHFWCVKVLKWAEQFLGKRILQAKH